MAAQRRLSLGLGRLEHLHYAKARAKLIRAGYRPLQLQHDERDLFCEKDFCQRFPEAIECADGEANPCEYVFERPDARRRHGSDRYIVVIGEGELFFQYPEFSDQIVARVVTADKGDMKAVWARQDLKRRGCLESGPITWRDCDPEPPSPDILDPPPLPPSLR